MTLTLRPYQNQAMKERPILFSAPMVRAILDGSKTQTRRVATMRVCGGKIIDVPSDNDAQWVQRVADKRYGKPGDRLWVRETWAVQHEYDAAAPSEIGSNARWHYAATEDLGGLRKRPSIFLPRRGSRIRLEITGVRVERLQQISEADAIAEGCPLINPNPFILGHGASSASGWFSQLWEDINGSGSWDANPWVWVIEFRRPGTLPEAP